MVSWDILGAVYSIQSRRNVNEGTYLLVMVTVSSRVNFTGGGLEYEVEEKGTKGQIREE